MKKELKSILLVTIICVIMMMFIGRLYDTKVNKQEIEEIKIENEEITEIEEIEVDENLEEDVVEEIEESKTSSEVKTPKRLETQKENVQKETTKTPIEVPNEILKNEEVEETDKKEEIACDYISLGTFKLTAYCNCSKCCGKWAGGATASGVMPTANHTIAVDTNLIPFGTVVMINGNTYVAEDTGSAIKGNKIDIYFDSHQEAMNFGVQYSEVFVTAY